MNSDDIWDHSGSHLMLNDEELEVLSRSRLELFLKASASSLGEVQNKNFQLLHLADVLNAIACACCGDRKHKSPLAENVLELKAFPKYEFELGLQEAAKASP